MGLISKINELIDQILLIYHHFFESSIHFVFFGRISLGSQTQYFFDVHLFIK